MPTDFDELLSDAANGPERTLDVEQLWARGRRRRRARQVAASLGGVTMIVVAAVVATGLGSGTVPVIEPVGTEESAPETGDPDPVAPDDPDAVETDDPDPDAPDDPDPDAGDPTLEAGDPSSDVDDPSSDVDDPAPGRGDPGPVPDPQAVLDPCASQETGPFVAVVSPVEGQRVGDEFDLVGCANVFEGTVQYRILDTDGTVLIEAFTTTTAGMGQAGEFRETVTAPATGELTLEAYWEDVSDGSERSRVQVPFVAP